MVQRQSPPPVEIGAKDPVFSRWLIELTNNVAGLQDSADNQDSEITTLQQGVAQNTSDIAGTNTLITALAKLHNGAGAPANLFTDGDWYAQTGGPTHIYVQVAGAWVLII